MSCAFTATAPVAHPDPKEGPLAAKDVKFGLNTFGDVTVDADGKPLHQAQVIRNVVAEGVRADEVGIDYFAVGEHHRPDFAVSAPDVVLAGLATATENIHRAPR